MSSVTVVPASRRGCADGPRVLEGDLLPVVPERLPDRGQLDRDLDPAALGEAGVGQLPQHGQVGVAHAAGVLDVGGVLAEVVQRRRQALPEQLPAGADGVLGLGARDVAAHDVA